MMSLFAKSLWTLFKRKGYGQWRYTGEVIKSISIFHVLRITISNITVWAKESSANVGQRLNPNWDIIAGLNFTL